MILSSRSLRLLLTLVGSSLLILNLAGFFIPTRERSSIPDKPIPGLHIRELEVNVAQSRFNQLKKESFSPEEKLSSLFKLVSSSFIRMPNYKIEPWDNWILWSAGQWDSSYNFTQDVDLLWKRGAGLCLQSSMIFSAKAKELGFDARIGLLTGHVVTEILIPDKGWRVYDSDLGIIWDNALNDFGSQLDLETISKRIQSAGFSKQYSNEIAKIYTSQSDNSHAPFPMRADRLKLEEFTKWISWIIPMGMIFIGIFFGRRAQRKGSLDALF